MTPLELIARAVSDVTGITIEQMRAKGRREDVAYARFMVYSVAAMHHVGSRTTEDWFGQSHGMSVHAIKKNNLRTAQSKTWSRLMAVAMVKAEVKLKRAFENAARIEL